MRDNKMIVDNTEQLLIFRAILQERRRQDDLKRERKFEFSCADRETSDFFALAILLEEVGEVARATLGRHGKVCDGQELESELIQVAAVTVAWLEKLAKETVEL
jgi:NTP pyrophosphatase (non-canonical NTP hydrolase)